MAHYVGGAKFSTNLKYHLKECHQSTIATALWMKHYLTQFIALSDTLLDVHNSGVLLIELIRLNWKADHFPFINQNSPLCTLKMTSVHRELVQHLIETLEDEKCTNPNVLVIGKDAKTIASLLPHNFTIHTMACPTEITQQSNGNCYDALVVNEIFHRLVQEKAEKLMECILKATKVDGVVQVRQYLHSSKWNLSNYSQFFESHRLVEEDGKKAFGLKIIWEEGLRCTIATRHDWRDHCWMLKKIEIDPIRQIDQPISVRENFDRNHYNDQKIWKYEWIFGHGFMSPGGATENGKFLSMLNLKPSDYILDVGSGVGGNAFQISQAYNAQVLGVDLSSNTVRIAYDRAAMKEDMRVRFMFADAMDVHLPASSFDVAYSRDAILHIADKRGLFEKIYTWLKPGGQMLITDYMTGDKETFCDGFQGFMSNREFTLRTLDHYVTAAKKAGFDIVDGHDITARFKELLLAEIASAEEKKVEFLKVFSDEEYKELVGGWRNKILWIEEGDLKWGMVRAVKGKTNK